MGCALPFTGSILIYKPSTGIAKYMPSAEMHFQPAKTVYNWKLREIE
jgi:hypothetical protein